MAGQILEFWRKNLKSCSDSGDIFEVINRAIFIAGLDHPKELKNHREEIIEKLYKTEVALAELNREKQKVLIKASKGFDQVAKKVDKESPSSTVIDHVERGVQISASDSDHVAVSNTRNNKKILPIIRMKRVKKMNSEDDWVVTIVPRKMEAGSGEEASKYCYSGGGECQAKSSSGSVHNTSSPVLKEENTKEVQTTTRVGCLHEEALIQRKLETSKRKLEDGYQATAKRQHLIKVLDTCDLPKTCTALDEEAMIRQKLEISKRKLKEGYQAEAKKQHLIKVLDPNNLPKSCATVSQRYRKGPAVRRCY